MKSLKKALQVANIIRSGKQFAAELVSSWTMRTQIFLSFVYSSLFSAGQQKQSPRVLKNAYVSANSEKQLMHLELSWYHQDFETIRWRRSVKKLVSQVARFVSLRTRLRPDMISISFVGFPL